MNPLTSTELALTSSMTLGSLESNAEQILEVVKARVEDYLPEFYEGRADAAKADRAVLNKAEKLLNSKRLELEREYLAPFEKFKATINESCKLIKVASGQLDAIVKEEEQKEKSAKRDEIKAYWDSKNFTLVDFERIFCDNWLNKTTKLDAVKGEIDGIISKVMSDLTIIDRFSAEDVPLVKSFYLECLDLSLATGKAEELKANRDRLVRENAERAEIEKATAIKAQSEELASDMADAKKDDGMKSLIAEALEIEKPKEQEMEFALCLKGSKSALFALRAYMNELGITYRRLTVDGYGKYKED